MPLPRRVAKVLLSQPRGDDGIIRPKISQEELAEIETLVKQKRKT